MTSLHPSTNFKVSISSSAIPSTGSLCIMGVGLHTLRKGVPSKNKDSLGPVCRIHQEILERVHSSYVRFHFYMTENI